MIIPSELQSRAGISKGYASELLAGNKRPAPAMALRIFHATGLKFGPLVGLDADEIAVMDKVHGASPAAANDISSQDRAA